MSELKLDLELRNYLITGNIPLAIIDFEKSIIEQKHDGGSYLENYQILVLKKPTSYALELEAIDWLYKANKVLLIYNRLTKKISTIPLEFCFNIDDGNEKEFYFSDYMWLEQNGDHIMILAGGRNKDNHSCCYVALFSTTGEIISVWETENINSHKISIRNFCDLGNGRWLVNFEIHEGEKYKPAVKRLCLLTVGKPEANSLLLEQVWDPPTGSLLSAKTKEILSWFSAEQVDDNPAFFVLACFRQCCVYRHETSHGEAKYPKYEKIADITLDNLYVKHLAVDLTDDRVSVSLFNNKELTKPTSFYFEFDRNPN